MVQNRKYLLEKFEEHLLEKFKVYCSKLGKNCENDGLVTFLIDQDLITPVSIKRYAVLQEFIKLSEDKQFSKSQTVSTIADIFNISERTVWGILKYGKQIQTLR